MIGMRFSPSYEQSVIPYLFVAGIGLSVALLVWLLSGSVAQTPAEDRQYKDPPPIGFHAIWWVLQWSSHGIRQWIPDRIYLSLQSKLRKAGLDYCLSPEQFIASRIVCVCLFGAVAMFVLHSIEGLRSSSSNFAVLSYIQLAAVAGLLGWAYPALWLRDRLAVRRSEVLKTLPFFLDIFTLCVEAGLTMQGALSHAVIKGPKGVLREEMQRVLRDIRAGKTRAIALRDMAQRLNEASITNFTTAVIQAEAMGMNLGPMLRAQADQRRSERFLRAEKLAMEAPVKMLFPLIAFIFPCTFLVLFFPIVVQFMHTGL
jgi:tight adherence protein C